MPDAPRKSSSAWTQSSAAQDAEFPINGIAASGSTNAVTSAISGVTLNLTSAAVTTPATTQTLTVEPTRRRKPARSTFRVAL
ncbi:hypothetical protein BZM26_36135 [Paraburkholderia strydomiana]|nr:hypothetical protein BZM26_36135 [Paraburkholderia strydomiana]